MKMTQMMSGEGEQVEFSEELYPAGNVEDWLGEVERVMMESVRAQCSKAVVDYANSERTEWVLKWPGVFADRWSYLLFELLSKF